MQTLVSYVRSGQPDLTNRQMALMLLVYMTPGPHTVRGLANILGVSKPVITRALNTLGTLGYLRRVRDEADRRNVFVARTNVGQEFLESFERNIEQDGHAPRRAAKERGFILPARLSASPSRPRSSWTSGSMPTAATSPTSRSPASSSRRIMPARSFAAAARGRRSSIPLRPSTSRFHPSCFPARPSRCWRFRGDGPGAIAATIIMSAMWRRSRSSRRRRRPMSLRRSRRRSCPSPTSTCRTSPRCRWALASPATSNPAFSRPTSASSPLLRCVRSAPASMIPVAVAERLLDSPYLMGGAARAGSTARASCRCRTASAESVRRETAISSARSKPLDDPDALQRGDLIFFEGHVGMMIDAQDLIHATGHHGRTVIEPLDAVAGRTPVVRPPPPELNHFPSIWRGPTRLGGNA